LWHYTPVRAGETGHETDFPLFRDVFNHAGGMPGGDRPGSAGGIAGSRGGNRFRFRADPGRGHRAIDIVGTCRNDCAAAPRRVA